MGWAVALVTITALVMLGFILSRPEAEKDWRGGAEGLRRRLERDGVPRADTVIARPDPGRLGRPLIALTKIIAPPAEPWGPMRLEDEASSSAEDQVIGGRVDGESSELLQHVHAEKRRAVIRTDSGQHIVHDLTAERDLLNRDASLGDLLTVGQN
jgi:hypothetical protein